MVPFFISLTVTNPMDSGSNISLTLATVSSVVANVSGLLTGGLYLFLRSSTISTIGPKDKSAEYDRQKLKYNIRLQGPDRAEVDGGQAAQSESSPFGASESHVNLFAVGKGYPFETRTNSMALNSNPFVATDYNLPNSQAGLNSAVMPRAPEPAQVSTSTRPHSRRPSMSYSLFPSDQPNANSATLLPSTTYSPNSNAGISDPKFSYSRDSNSTLRPPPLLGPEGFRHHRRDSSLASSATVQIGLRFSNFNDVGPMSTKNSIEMERVHTLDCPDGSAPGFSQRPGPLARAQQPEPIVLNAGSAGNRPEPAETAKTQPQVSAPSPSQPSPGPTLSPTVYTPPGSAVPPTRGRIISPKGVGFNVPRRINTTPEQSSSSSSTVPAPLRLRGYSNADKGKEQWI